MANEHDVLAAWLRICREDTTPTVGLVALTGKDDPAVTWGEPSAMTLPVIVLPEMPTARVFRGAPARRAGTWHVEARTGRGGLKLASQLLDRLEAITTFSAFDALGFDVQVDPVGRSKEPPGEQGGYRLVADYRLTVTV